MTKLGRACGVAQELPCGKSGCTLGDGACQVNWMNSYVMERYKSWANAVAFHDANNWY
ncbi:aggregation-promoting factor C-terminal-like domain-containing protein [Loigolactobacillus coryniformis]